MFETSDTRATAAWVELTIEIRVARTAICFNRLLNIVVIMVVNYAYFYFFSRGHLLNFNFCILLIINVLYLPVLYRAFWDRNFWPLHWPIPSKNRFQLRWGKLAL